MYIYISLSLSLYIYVQIYDAICCLTFVPIQPSLGVGVGVTFGIVLSWMSHHSGSGGQYDCPSPNYQSRTTPPFYTRSAQNEPGKLFLGTLLEWASSFWQEGFTRSLKWDWCPTISYVLGGRFLENWGTFRFPDILTKRLYSKVHIGLGIISAV